MKASEVGPALAQINADIEAGSKLADQLKEKLRGLTAKRATLESAVKLLDLPPSPIRDQVWAAAGIEPDPVEPVGQ